MRMWRAGRCASQAAFTTLSDSHLEYRSIRMPYIVLGSQTVSSGTACLGVDSPNTAIVLGANTCTRRCVLKLLLRTRIPTPHVLLALRLYKDGKKGVTTADA